MRTYDFTLPWPPSINGYRAVARNRIITTARGRDFKAKAISKMFEQGLTGEALAGNVSLSIVLNPPTLRRYDVDNYCKAILDAITESGFWLDDEQVSRLKVVKGKKLKDGRVDINVTCID